MKSKKLITLIATLGLICCCYNKVDAVQFYDTLGTRYEGAVERLNELEIINGVSEKVFNAEKNVTRAEFSKMITKALLSKAEFSALIIDDDNCNYKDIEKDKWYYEYVVAATNLGLVKGYEDNTFRPDKNVTYEEASKIIMKALGHTYLREDSKEGWAREYLDKMYALKINEGTYHLNEKEPATRGNIAIMIWNMVTNNIWQKIELNDKEGFTFIDSGRTIFDKNFASDYAYIKDVEVKGLKEINGKLYINFGGIYYRFYDEEVTVKMSMLGSKATALLYKIKDESNKLEEIVVIGLSTDIGYELKEGKIEELKKDYKFGKNSLRLAGDADYAYLLYDPKEEKTERVIYFNTSKNSTFVDSVEIKVEKEEKQKNEKEEEETGDKEENSKKTIIINEEEKVINDGAVLFKNNRRVDWKELEKGDVITEVKKDEYYILTRTTFETELTGIEKEKNLYKFITKRGEYLTLSNTECLKYLSDKSVRLNSIPEKELEKIIGKQIRIILDISENIIRTEFIEGNQDAEIIDADIGYFYAFDYNSDSKGKINYLTVISNDTKKTYRTSVTSTDAELGDIISFKFDEKNVVSEIKKISDSTEINDNYKFKKYTLKNLNELKENKAIDEEIVIYSAKYDYDFGEYEKIIDFDIKKINLIDLLNMPEDKIEIYGLTEKIGALKLLVVQDFTNKKDVFYGEVKEIKYDEGKMKIRISVLDGKEYEFLTLGLANCEEGDFISFKIVDKDTIKVMEKYITKALGYYKDLVINDVYNKEIDTQVGKLNFELDKIKINEKEYNLNEYTFILFKVRKGIDNNWQINKISKIEKQNLKFEINDRIAIDEIENTMIIYRGYTN